MIIRAEDWQPRILGLVRVVAGLLFLEHGLSKLFGFPHDPRFYHMTLLSLLGIAGVLETAGGLLITIGLLTRPVAFILSGQMAVAYFVVHAPNAPFPMLNGGDAAILFCFLFLYLSVAGGGAWSLDRLRQH